MSDQNNPTPVKDFRAYAEAPDPILWQDRKRYLGMPLSFTRYSVDGDRFIERRGFFRTATDETLLYRILDLKLERSLGQKLFGVGTIIMYTADQTGNRIHVVNIRNSEKVRKFLSRIIEQERDKRRISGRELFGVAGASMGDLDGDGIPD